MSNPADNRSTEATVAACRENGCVPAGSKSVTAGETAHSYVLNVVDVGTVEEAVLNPDALAPELRGWRYYRLEYGGCNEDCIWEGRVLLPPNADPDALAQLILGMQAHGQIWRIE